MAELMSALSLATDLGLGQPLQHELGVCLAALELADRLGCSTDERSDVYYVALVAHVGCTGVAGLFAEWAGGDDINFQRGAQLLPGGAFGTACASAARRDGESRSLRQARRRRRARRCWRAARRCSSGIPGRAERAGGRGARLVARGKTSKEIARPLTITEKTAGHHVEHIYAKVGVSTRVGAALFAMEHDLVEERRNLR